MAQHSLRSWFDPDLYGSESEEEVKEEPKTVCCPTSFQEPKIVKRSAPPDFTALKDP